jgi:hypothetical protein
MLVTGAKEATVELKHRGPGQRRKTAAMLTHWGREIAMELPAEQHAQGRLLAHNRPVLLLKACTHRRDVDEH